ncbi:hypothetical protein Tco_0613751 [Tanacetum coccineum]
MVAYLKKPTGSEGFQEIVDFLNRSHIRYALTKNPTIYVSLIEKFWQTATVRTVDNGEQEITAIVDGKYFTITEASVRRHLQLANADGISVLPYTEIFDQLTPINMKRGFSGEHTPLFPSMLALQAEEGEGSGNPSEPQPPPSTAQPTHEELIPNIKSSSPQKTQSPRQALNKDTELPQTSVPIPNTPRDHRGASVQTRFERASKLSYDSPLEGGNTPRSDEDSMTLQELMTLCTKLSDRVLALETDLRQTKKGRMIEEIDQDTGVSLVTLTKVSSQEDQHEDQLGVLSAAKVLTDAARAHTYSRRRRVVSTGSGGVSTASRIISTTEESVSTAGMIQQVNIIIPSSSATKDKGKAIMIESEPEQTTTKLKQRQERAGYEAAIRLQEQLDAEESQRIARDAEGFTEDEWEDIRARVKADEELTQKLQAEERDKYSEVDQAKMLVDLINQRKRYFATQKAEAKRNKPMTHAQQRIYMSNYIKHMGSHTMQQLKSYTFDELKALFETTIKHVSTFTSMETEDKERESKLAAGSSKRPAKTKLIMKDLVKERFSITEPIDDKEKALWVDLKRLFEPDNDDTLWKLQRYMHDPLTWKLYDTCGVHHVSSVRGHDIFMLVEKDYPLTRATLGLMLVARLLVEEDSEMANELIKKIFYQANRPRQ